MTQLRAPGGGGIFLGIAVASFATGPCLIGLLALFGLVSGTDDTFNLRWGQIPNVIVMASAICLIGSVPAASINAYLLSRAARSDMDTIWASLVSGGLVGGIVLVVLNQILGTPRLISSSAIFGLGALFVATGACMGLLHWVIAIRPRRRWRLRLMRDETAIRAME